ncbi:MAG: NYN domain-containing protein, partial [Gemmatimonadaceae bacterium]
MNSRYPRTASRAQSALIHRGPQALSAAPHALAPIHAPNAALLIDFDNVTMGIRSDLGKELRSLLSSEIIKGKVAVQRAYADWRRYPQYIVPLSEASIDLIFAPAYGSSKKNATDIRLAIDALELVFTRPEIGTFILLSGDSDFSSLVIKLKEYGKYVIGVGIRESSSDLLVQNCDEYYSYNALAGLVKQSDDEPTKKYDPWELVTESVQRMKRNNDVMRSDRLKQVMQEIDSTFDEKNLGISKFSRFCQEAAQRGLLTVTKLENGQLEVDLPTGTPVADAPPVRNETVPASVGEGGDAPVAEDRGPRRGRRGRGGRGRDREERTPREQGAPQMAGSPAAVPDETSAPVAEQRPVQSPAQSPAPRAERPAQLELAADHRAPAADPGTGSSGERLTRAEAFDLVRRTINDVAPGEASVRASDVRRRARELLGRDSESLSDRMFVRILKDAHDEGIIDLRKRGDDFEVARAAEAAPVSEQLARSEQSAVAASTPPSTSTGPAPRIGMGHRGGGAGRNGVVRGRPGAPPPELLAIGVVQQTSSTPPAPSEAPVASAQPKAAAPVESPVQAEAAPAKPARGGRGTLGVRGGRAKGGAKQAPPSAASIAAAAPAPVVVPAPPTPPAP